MSDAEDVEAGAGHPGGGDGTAAGTGPGQDPLPGLGSIGNLGDSICYAGVPAKVEAIQAELRRRVTDKDLPVRVIAPNYASGISDGQRNGTPEMRYSLIGRETTNDGVCLHLEGSDVRGVIAVVACDKPPVGTLAAILEHNVPAVIMSDGSIRPGIDSLTGEPIDIVVLLPGGGGIARPSGAAWRWRARPATAAAAGCSPTTPCSRSSRPAAWSRCTW